MILDSAYNRDMELLLRMFSVFDQKATYNEVYLQYCKLNKHIKVLHNETETLTRWLWKYKNLTLAEFRQYF
jgi:hypothetical protein